MTYSRLLIRDAGTQPRYSGCGIPGTHSLEATTLPHQTPSRSSHADNNPGCTSSCGHLMIRTHTGIGKSATTSTVNGERMAA